jgi:tRNA pseudouridine38-40 synthase
MNAHRAVWVLALSYDGSDFRGWQRQPAMRTVQGTLETALASLTGRMPTVYGAARTDAGVHARGQVAHFAARPAETRAGPGGLDEGRLLDALREILPPSLRATKARLSPRSFHARASAIGKRYVYKFRWGPRDPSVPGEPAFDLGPRAAPDWERARAALTGLSGLALLPGLSSPSTDRRPAPGLKSWELRLAAHEAALDVCAPAFRKREVRNLAGHLATVALGLAAPETLAALAARSRPWMGATAPPHGLCLEEVLYPAAHDPFALREA